MCWSVIIEGTSDKVRLRPGNLRRVRPPLMGGEAVREQVRVCRILLSGSRSRAGELLMLRLQVLMTTPAAANLNQVDMLGTGRALPPSVSTLWSDSQPRQPASLVSQPASSASQPSQPALSAGQSMSAVQSAVCPSQSAHSAAPCLPLARSAYCSRH